MTLKLYGLDRKEERSRKIWLIITLFQTLVPFMSLVVFLRFFSDQIQLSESLVSSVSSLFIVGLISLWVTWHCAYKKHGTLLLTWYLVISPFQFILTISKCLKENNFYVVIGSIIMISSMYILEYVFSLNLRKINKKIQIWKIQAEKESCPEYLQALQALKKASSIEDLNNLLHKAIQAWPRFEELTSKEYKLIKSNFTTRNDFG